MNGAVTVSILIPAYGTADYIAETLDSALAQSRTDREVIVINDGDPDTEALERALAPYRDQIVYVTKPNGGLASARNAGLRVAKGQYVALLDSDDLWEPNFLEQLLAPLEADASLGVAFPDASIFGGGPWVGKRYFDIYTKPAAENPVDCRRLLRRECYVFGSLVMRRELLDRAGGFDDTLRASEDFDLWLRFAQAGVRFTYVDRPLVRYRARVTSLSSDSSGMYRSLEQVYAKFLRQEGVAAEDRRIAEEALMQTRASLALAAGRKAFFAGDYSTAIRELTAANRTQNSRKTAVILLLLRTWPGGFGAAARWYMRRRGQAV